MITSNTLSTVALSQYLSWAVQGWAKMAQGKCEI